MDWHLGGERRNALLAVVDPSLCAFLTVHLQERGCQVTSLTCVAELGEAAVAADLLIADLALLRASALEPRYRPSQILTLTPEIGPGDEDVATELGACALLRVPFEDGAALAGLLDAMVARAAQPLAEPALV